MKIRAFAVLTIGLMIPRAAWATDQRPQLQGVSTVRIANYGTPSTVITDRERVRSIVDELRRLRGKAWRQADTKLSCYATLVLLNDTKTVALFRVKPDLVVERPQKKAQSSFSLEIADTDMPRISALLTEIPPAKDCT